MWELNYKESWAAKNWCFWTVVLEKTLKSPLDCKEIKPVNHKGNQSWIFIGRIDAEAETPILWPPHAKSWLTGKDWCWEGLGAEEGDGRGWDGWMASQTRWMWVWVNSGSWWWTGRPGVLRFMGSQRVGHNWTTELDWTELSTAYILLSQCFVTINICFFNNQSILNRMETSGEKLTGMSHVPSSYTWLGINSTHVFDEWIMNKRRNELFVIHQFWLTILLKSRKEHSKLFII